MTQFVHDQKIADAKKKYNQGLITLDEYEAIVAQADYELEKTQKYQDYKAGKITNYAYIQWKKQNDPSKQPKTATVAAPAASKTQTPAPKQTAASTAKTAAMTQAEYDAAKKEMYKKYKNGEITNYAYIQWKKQNDPSKNGYAAGQNGPVTAPKSGGGTSTGAGTKAASKAITSAELKQLKQELTDKYTSGEITWEELNDYGAELSEAYKQGKSLGEAKQLMPGAVKAATPAQAAPKLTIAEENQYDKIAEMVNDLATDGEIDYDDANELHDLLGKLIKAGIKPDEAELAVGDIVYSMDANGQTVTDTDAYKDIIKKAAAQTAATASGAAVTAAAAPAATVPDPGTQAADDAVDKLEKELKRVYRQAVDEMNGELAEFTTKYGDKLAAKQALVASGQMTQAELDEWIKNQGAIIDLMNAKIEQMTDTLLNANQKAIGMVNGERFGVFAEAANWQSYQLTQDAKMNLSFAIYDEDTVEKLIKEKPELLPRKEVNGKKDKAWNQNKIAKALTQGILQGESIPKLAKRIAADTASENGKAMIRYARTAMTGAQNSGRMEMLHRAVGMGINVKKRWLATLDSRTRDSHRDMDGVTIGVDEKFKTPLGSEMDYPGDLAGLPGDVWNCRCTLIYDYVDFPNDPSMDQRIQYDDYYTTYKDSEGKKHKVYHRAGSSLITDMNYDEWKAAKQSSKLNDLNLAKVSLADAQKAVIKAKIKEDKVYSDIWKDDVTLADYPAKKGSIQGKRDYYTAEIDKLEHAIANGSSWASPDKLKELKKKLKLLNEFEKNGELLEKRNAALKTVQDIYDQVGFGKTATAPTIAQPQPAKKAKKAAGAAGGTSAGAAAGTGAQSATTANTGQFAPDAWDAKTKKAARNFDDKYKADKVLRPELDAMWDTLTDEEKYAVWLYTWNSNPMNKPLSGHHDSWNRLSGFVGYDKAEWGHEDNYSNRYIANLGEMGKFARSDGHAEYRKGIILATKAIDKASLQEGQWLVRGSDENGLAGWFAGAGMNFDDVTKLFNGNYTAQDFKNALVGKKAINHAFTSTGIATGTGFSGNVKYKIYAPKGTHGIYAEPQSHYGDTTGGYMGTPVAKNRQDKIYRKGEKYPDVGDEAEVILQRGTTYVCTGVKVTGTNWSGKPNIEIELEVVEQPDYFTHGDENTYDGGKTRHKK